MTLELHPAPVPARSRGSRRQLRRDPWETIALVTAVVLPGLIGLDHELRRSVTIGMATSVVLLPVWIRPARTYAGSGVLAWAVIAYLVGSVVLGQWNAVSHPAQHGGAIDLLLVMGGTSCCVGALLWCRTLVPVGLVALSFGAGSLLAAIADPGPLAAENPWKFAFSLPLTIMALGAAALIGRWWCEIGFLLLFAGLGVVNDLRSTSALLIITLLLLIWQARPRFPGLIPSAFAGIVFLAGLAYVIYRAVEASILNGFLGAETQARTQAQIDQSGSLILGGRPEVGATWALLHDNLLGFGAGIGPTMHDVTVAKTGLKALGYPPDNGYVERYMFGQGHIELHSVIGDLWAVGGLAGLALCGVLGWVALRYAGHAIATGTGIALGYFLAVRLLWDLGFSPLPSAMSHLVLAVAVLLLPRATRVQGRPVDGEVVGRGPAPLPGREVGTPGHGLGTS